MKLAVWKTGHEIADTVAQSLAEGFDAEIYNTSAWEAVRDNSKWQGYDAHIGYGILRGMSDVFRACEATNRPWHNCDRGYFNPSHYDGYYRISYKGTQARYDVAYPIIRSYEGELKSPRKDDPSKPILICPPTDAVCEFFGVGQWSWRIAQAAWEPCPIIRNKGDPNPINWDDYRAVITFNSSVGWQALINGIPCLSDPTHSVVGSYYNTKSIDECIEMFNTRPRKPLLDFMASHQFTLAEIRQGLAWPLLKHYLSSSDGIQESQLQHPSASTPSGSALKHRFQSIS
jgi:hypothetical protein